MKISERIKNVHLFIRQNPSFLTKDFRVRPILFHLAVLSFAISSIAIVFFGLYQNSLSTVAAYFLFGLIGFLISYRAGETPLHIYCIVFGLATIASIMLYFIFVHYYGVPYLEGGSDELHYEEIGAIFARNQNMFDYGSIRGNLVSEWHNSVGYIYLIGLLSKFGQFFGGEHTMVPRLFNVTCLSLVSVLTFLFGERLGLQRKTSVSAAFFTGCLPIMMWVSIQTLRDIVIALLLLLLVYIWLPIPTRTKRFHSLLNISLSVLILLPIFEMRKAQAFVGLIIVLYAFLRNLKSKSFKYKLLFIVPFLTTIIFIYLKVIDLLTLNIFEFIGEIDSYSIFRAEVTGGGLSRSIFESSLLPFGWLYRTAYALVSPLPVEFSTIDKAWLSLGTIIQVLFIPFLYVGIRLTTNLFNWQIVLMAFLLLFIGMAFFTFTIRHITQYLPFAILLSAFGFERYSGSRYRVFLTMGLIGVSLATLYIIIKKL